MKRSDIEVFFYKSRGPGGQRKNRKETAVKIVHLPTGITCRATEYRFQAKNKELALLRLEEKLRKLKEPQKRRKATRKPFHVREKELQDKKLRSKKKALRKKVEEE